MMKTWVPVDGTNVVHYPFEADDSYITNYQTRVVERADLTTPPWYHAGVTFMDVTAMDPRPTLGWFQSGSTWVDGNPVLEVDRQTIPADGVTAAVVSFSQKGPAAPKTVRFEVNGAPAIETLVDGRAAIEVTSSNPGDVVTITAGGRSIDIMVDL